MAKKSAQPVEAASLTKDHHRLIDGFIKHARATSEMYNSRRDRVSQAEDLCGLSSALRAALVQELMVRTDKYLPADNGASSTWNYTNDNYRTCFALTELLNSLLPAAVKGRADVLEALCRWIPTIKVFLWPVASIKNSALRAIETHSIATEITPAMREWLAVLRSEVSQESKPDQSKLSRITDLLGESKPLGIHPGEAWSDAAISYINGQSAKTKAAWIDLIDTCINAGGAAPTAKWLAAIRQPLGIIGLDAFATAILEWFALVEKPRLALLHDLEQRAKGNEWVREHLTTTYGPGSMLLLDHHMDILKGLCWIAGTPNTPDLTPDLTRAVGRLAISAYKKAPGVGPRAVKVGNAAVYALGQIPGRDALGQLAMLKIKVKFIPAQKGIEKALTAAATREGLPRDEIEELAVPTYGLTDVGLLEEPLGDYTARLTIAGAGDSELIFLKPDGKAVKSLPAAVKASHAEELKTFKAATKDIAAMVPAQKDRIDSLFLEQKTWAFPTWRERYIDHPVVGIIARRLIWLVQEREGGPLHAVTHLDGALVGVDGKPRSFNEDAAIVRLWHPLDVPEDQVLAWRRFFEDRAIKQPFKQAHREVYILTDAERNTNTYSNRYAAHIIRQHQFHALAAARGWRNKLRLAVDDEYPPASRALEKWGLRAEYWIEAASNGDDFNDSGVYHHIITDQVRFYSINARQASAHAGGGGYSINRVVDPTAPRPAVDPDAPLPLDQIPALVLSEIMRDVDLFVGVASVGNNPNWQDGGPDNRFRDYWWSYGFGELSGTAHSRRDLLGRLIPRLKIAPLCTLADKFLIVKGSLRTYKIHLGSGNILMEPNDQYLCIVPNARETDGGEAHLPFEGDRTLSIILSKAFMLAADTSIKDASIVSQIKRKA